LGSPAARAGAPGRPRGARQLSPVARYRLARTRAALANSACALLCFGANIRYTTSTVIGEWRDSDRAKPTTGNGDPYVDFGSAAKHHRLHAPWL
jgi:Xaa-Pro dipeptidase